MALKIKAVVPWLFFILIAAAFLYPVLAFLIGGMARPADWVELAFPIIPIIFAFFGALIISQKPGNVIGILLMLPGASFFALIDFYFRPFVMGYASLPVSPSPMFLLLLWFSNWNWILLVLPIMYIMLLFPTGKPLSRRWGWLVYFGIFLASSLPVSTSVNQVLAPVSGSGNWSYPNPIGFLSTEQINSLLTPLLILFPIWIVLCVVSLFVRFRRSRAVEREQIKWLFFAAAVFALCYIPWFFGNNFTNSENFWNLLFLLGLTVFPVSIGMAILKYHLFDIEIVIRRTLVYTLLTGMLALVYFGGVTLLQSIFVALSGQQSPAALVISTLFIAALVSSLRRRIQGIIDRRFYRQKYDAEQALAQFAAAARSETDLARLSARLTSTVQESLQPERISLWMQPAKPLRGEIYERQKVQK